MSHTSNEEADQVGNGDDMEIKLDDNIDLMTHSIKSPREKSESKRGSLLDQILQQP